MWVVISMYVQGDPKRSNKSQLAKLKRSKAKYSVQSKKKLKYRVSRLAQVGGNPRGLTLSRFPHHHHF